MDQGPGSDRSSDRGESEKGEKGKNEEEEQPFWREHSTAQGGTTRRGGHVVVVVFSCFLDDSVSTAQRSAVKRGAAMC